MPCRAHPRHRHADGHAPLTTHIFDSESDYLDRGAVVGVKDSLVKGFPTQPDGTALPEHDFVLVTTGTPGDATAPGPPP